MIRKFFLLLCIVSLNVSNTFAVRKIIVQTTNGPVRGKLNYYGNFAYYSFQSIPYAESPAGLSRFKPPIPKKPWEDVLDATQETVVCPQLDTPYHFDQMREDCLVLNIYAPKNSTNGLPVLVFIHGGGFASLSGNSDYLYGPQFFLQREMIVVTLNFRIGPLGFLSLGINEASGNAGIKDVILALKWIKANVSKFGGNNRKITIGGHSSGAALVHYLMLTKQTVDLFQQAILISGSALNTRFLSLHPRDNALSLAGELGIKDVADQTVLRELQKADVFDIIQAYRNLSETNGSIYTSCTLFAPCVEKNFSHAVITENPLETLEQSGLIRNIPILAGINSLEGIYFLPRILSKPKAADELFNNSELCIPGNIEYPAGSREAKRLGDDIGNLYFDKNNSDNHTLGDLIQLTSDTQYDYSVYAWVKLYKSHHRLITSLYFYIFDFDGDLNWAKLNYNITYPGTAHSDELGYIFVTNKTANRIENANIASKRMINVTVNLFSNFVKFGMPYDDGIMWTEFDMKNQNYLHISTHPSVKSLLNHSKKKYLQFWETAYFQYQQYVKNGGQLENKCRNHELINKET